jgi:hypothetical protein
MCVFCIPLAGFCRESILVIPECAFFASRLRDFVGNPFLSFPNLRSLHPACGTLSGIYSFHSQICVFYFVIPEYFYRESILVIPELFYRESILVIPELFCRESIPVIPECAFFILSFPKTFVGNPFLSFPNSFIGNPFAEFMLKSWINAKAGMTLLWLCY